MGRIFNCYHYPLGPAVCLHKVKDDARKDKIEDIPLILLVIADYDRSSFRRISLLEMWSTSTTQISIPLVIC